MRSALFYMMCVMAGVVTLGSCEESGAESCARACERGGQHMSTWASASFLQSEHCVCAGK